MKYKPIVLIVRDGWGYREEKEKNAIKNANTPYTDMLMKEYPNTLIEAAGRAVGLPEGYMGNSEVGHLTIGAGRIILQPFERINQAIRDKSFFNNKAFLDAMRNCKEKNTSLHIIGLIQREGVHSHMDHCIALLELCAEQGLKDVLVHIISDGRDSPVHNTLKNTRVLLEKMSSLGVGRIASVNGRYYAMDRDKRWDRTKIAYDCIVLGEAGEVFEDPVKCFEEAYAKGETDEFLKPKKHSAYEGISDDDSVIFFNYRTDRPRQLTQAIIEDDFPGWERQPLNVRYVAMTEYYNPMSKRASVAFPPVKHDMLLGDILAENGLKQLRLAETEKYAHMTYFFNGEVEIPKKGEERVMIPSPKVATYDLQPEMSADGIGDAAVKALEDGRFDVIIMNFANSDMVGHTAIWEAVIKGVEAIDRNLEKVVRKVLEKGGVALVTADHGNCEDMTDEWMTSHTLNKVPFILVSNDEELKNASLKEGKGLKDIAPTILKLLAIEKPKEMTGESII